MYVKIDSNENPIKKWIWKMIMFDYLTTKGGKTPEKMII